MNRKALGWLRLVLAAAAVAALIWLPACAGTGKFGKIEEILADGVGYMPYSEAKDLWGEPTEVSQGEDVFTAYWSSESLGGMLKENLYLTFDKKKEILRAYRYVQKPK